MKPFPTPAIGLYRVARPVLFALEPETAHRFALTLLKLGYPFGPAGRPDPRLATRVWGRSFTSPIGLAAGFDKNGEAIHGCFRIGFGFVEIGGVTPLPQPGNPKPRLFRVPSMDALINRFGLNSAGVDAVALRLEAVRRRPGPIGVNLGRNKDSADAVADYVGLARRLAGAADYLVLNVSSPNTPGLRSLQDPSTLAGLIDAVADALPAESTDAARPALLVKLSPDLTAEDEAAIAELVAERPVNGLVISNTTIDRPAGLPAAMANEAGGLSGAPLRQRSTAMIARMWRLTGGRLPIVGVGGVASGQDAYDKILAGASLVQLYSALVYRGPGLVRHVNRSLAALLARDGFATVADAVGAGADRT